MKTPEPLLVLPVGARVAIKARPELHAEIIGIAIYAQNAIKYQIGWWDESHSYSEDWLLDFQVDGIIGTDQQTIGFSAP